jgi:probable F420-dependent oxidoreductase
MKIGAMMFATDLAIPVTRLAPELEARGFESLWIPEKTHLPASRRTPWPGGELPEWYKRTGDPLTTLAAAAAVTKRLRVGTGVSLVPVYDAVILAKAVATLDWLSQGRFEFGVGYGWNAEEYETHGVSLADAPAILRDKLALMTALWRDEVASYAGPHARVEPAWSWPKPVQKPRPKIHLGARASRAAFDDIAAFGDGWLPIEGYGEVVRHIPKLHDAFARADRRPEEASVSVYSSAGDARTLEAYRDAGVARVVLALPPASESEVLRALDRHARELGSFFAQ